MEMRERRGEAAEQPQMGASIAGDAGASVHCALPTGGQRSTSGVVSKENAARDWETARIVLARPSAAQRGDALQVGMP